jgi:thiamine pyrophosphate-dependent acetolactate synthase large subunit-like protein
LPDSTHASHALTTVGPGGVNLASGLHPAYQDNQAVLAFTNNVPTDQFGKGGIQDASGWGPRSISHVGLFKEFVKFAEACHAYGQLVERPTEIKEVLKNAFNSGRPSIIDVRIDPDEVPAGALERFETLVKKHPELGEKRIPTTTFPKKAT